MFIGQTKCRTKKRVEEREVSEPMVDCVFYLTKTCGLNGFSNLILISSELIFEKCTALVTQQSFLLLFRILSSRQKYEATFPRGLDKVGEVEEWSEK